MPVEPKTTRDLGRSAEPRGQVLIFRPRPTGGRPWRSALPPREDPIRNKWPEPWDDYHGDAGEEHPRRTLINIIGFAFTLLLIGAGLWLAHTLAEMRQIQDCVLSGRTNCAPIEIRSLRP